MSDVELALPDFVAKKQAQWERVSGRILGLQMVQYGQGHGTFMIVCSRDGFYEGVVFGQPGKPVLGLVGAGKRAIRRSLPNDQRPLLHQRIDFTDDELSALIDTWASGRSATTLPFVREVIGANGEPLRSA